MSLCVFSNKAAINNSVENKTNEQLSVSSENIVKVETPNNISPENSFLNTEKQIDTGISNMWSIAKAYWNDKRTDANPKFDIPVMPLEPAKLISESTDALFRLGHSTILLRVDGEFILFDPVFSDRASPVQWMGPKRFHQPPISIEQLPEIKAVVISHDHYDHLDKHAIKALSNKVEHFVTPLKVGEHLKSWDVESDKIIELNWWQSVNFNDITITAAPSQHFSGRGLFDKDKTLWASWAIKGSESNIYFSGDSGYFGGFKEIGERLGPFDITMIETGAYNELWPDVHMFPAQSVQAHIDLKGQYFLPIHNGTFDLSLHDWFEPFEQVTELSKELNVNLLTPVFGQEINIKLPALTDAWWRGTEAAKSDIKSNEVLQTAKIN